MVITAMTKVIAKIAAPKRKETISEKLCNSIRSETFCSKFREMPFSNRVVHFWLAGAIIEAKFCPKFDQKCYRKECLYFSDKTGKCTLKSLS
jgi:hypothetical protein